LLAAVVRRRLQWFTKRRKKALFDALEKVKSGTLGHDPRTEISFMSATHNSVNLFLTRFEAYHVQSS
jgi:hypothetical protein